MNPADTGEASVPAHAEPQTLTENGHEEPQDAAWAPESAEPDLPAPPPVIDSLRAAYAEKNGDERRKTFLIVPGRYRSALGFRAKPIPYEQFRKEADRAMRRGIDSAEAETAFAAKVIAHSCETIVVRDSDGELRPAEEVVNQYAGTGPVRFDSRLCEMLGIEPVPSSETEIARLVYSNKQAMQIALRELLAFFTEETAGDDEDEGDERPM